MEGRQTPPSRPPNPALPYREDCWSEGETSVLIDAWGDRYVELNRGNLRQKQWQEVADAVNSRPCDSRRPPRTDVQCKNRIDTLKKKYKVEKSKIVDGRGALASQWIFYNRLNVLIGTAAVTPKKQAPPSASSPPMALPLPQSHRKGYPLPTASAVRPFETKDGKRQTAIVPVMEDSFYLRSYALPPAAAAVAGESVDELDLDSSRSSGLYRKRPRPRPVSKERSGKGLRKGKEGGGDEDGIRELSKAIVRMVEIYEKVEVEKQRQMMELEKQRMEFAKSLEFQRMQMFVDSQVQLMKMKHAKRSDIDRYLP